VLAEKEAEVAELEAELADVRATVAQLDRDIEAARQAYRTLTKRLQQVKLAQADRTPSIEMVERPIEPDAPTSSRATIYLIIAAVLGLLLGLFVASFKRYVLHPATAEPRTEADQSATTEGD
ncbi:MAG: GNVR domain-containing protein, partial [Salinibacter sp.]